MLAAVGAIQLASVRSLAGADDADTAAARALAVDGPVELDLEADQRGVAEEVMHRCAPLRRRSPGDRTRAAHILQGAEAPLSDPHFSARVGAAHRWGSWRPLPRNTIDDCRPAVIAIPHEPGEGHSAVCFSPLPTVAVHKRQSFSKHVDALQPATFKN